MVIPNIIFSTTIKLQFKYRMCGNLAVYCLLEKLKLSLKTRDHTASRGPEEELKTSGEQTK